MDGVRATDTLSNPKRPRIDCVTTGREEDGPRPAGIPPPWTTEATGSPCMNLDEAARRHSQDPQWVRRNGGEKCAEDDFAAAASHADANAVTPRFPSADVSPRPEAGVDAEEEWRHTKRADEPASHSQREGSLSVPAEPNTPAPSDTGTVALLRRVPSLTWPGKSPEPRRPADARSPPPDEDDEGGRRGGWGDAREARAIPPSEGDDDEVKGRCVTGDAERDGRGGDSHGRSQSLLGGEGEGREGDGQCLRERFPLKGGGGDEDRAVPSDDVIMNLSGNVLGVEQNVENNEIMYNAEALREIKDAENSSAHSNPGAGCIGSPIITHDALLDGNVPDTFATKTGLGLVIDDLRGGEGTPGTGKMIADTPHKMADHTCVTMMPAQITQGPFEGDNDAGPFSVIDPAICSQAGRQDDEESSTSQSAEGVGLSPPGMGTLAHGTSLTPIPENFNGRRSAHNTKEIPSSDQAWRPDHLRGGPQLKGETHNACRSASEEMGFSVTTNESLNETQNEMHVDTFEKIQLSSSDDDCADEGPGHIPLPTSSPELLKSSRRQLPGTQPGVESNGQRELAKAEEVPGADAVRIIQPQREDTGKICFDSINRPCEILSRISTISPVSTLPVSQSVPATRRVSQAVFNNQLSAATDHDGDDDVPLAIETFRGLPGPSRTFQEFEMKQQFDKVVQELQQFFEIGSNEPSDSLSPDWGSVVNGPEETGAPGPREGRTGPLMESLRETSSEPVVPPHDPGTRELDQQVPPPDWSQPCLDGEDSMYSVGKHRQGTDPQRRLKPLRTCARPIRIGLSKRAKTSHLHRSHPYK
ncbi:unnamed protein product [Lota lota]